MLVAAQKNWRSSTTPQYKYYSTVSYFTDPHDFSATKVAWRCRLLACSVELGVKSSSSSERAKREKRREGRLHIKYFLSTVIALKHSSLHSFLILLLEQEQGG